MSTVRGNDLNMKAMGSRTAGTSIEDALPLQVIDWSPSRQPSGRLRALPSAVAWIQHETTSPSPLQIVLAPYQPRCGAEMEGMNLLLDHYQFPSEVLAERKQSVTHSFGALKLKSNEDVDIAWCHFLSKHLAVQKINGSVRVVENGIANDQSSQANSSWIMSDYFIHVRRSPSANTNGQIMSVTLLCFGAPQAVVERFHRLLSYPIWKDATQEPYVLFDFIYEELSQLVDDTAWMLADAFRPVEYSTLENAQDVDSTTAMVDFAGLHNASKHCTYLLEAVRAAAKTLDAMSNHLESTATNDLTKSTVISLRYRKRTFQSTTLRLESLEKRMANIISLSFHLVSQANNNVIREDSRVVKTIAVMTLIFLPATGVASVFSSPFFTVDFQQRTGSLRVADSFWIFWALTVPMTAGIVLLWWRWYKTSKRGRTMSQRLGPNEIPC